MVANFYGLVYDNETVFYNELKRGYGMKKIKVIVIAPYEGLKEIALAVAPAYRDRLEVTAILGDLTTGTVLAREAERKGYDVIVSRGGTAEMICKNVSVPVINIDISGYDYMRAIKMAENIQGPKAFVGFSYITERARSVNNLLRTDVDIFTIHSQEEIAPLLKELTSKGYELIIGDVATCREAREMDINNLLLTSGEESIIDAFESCLTWTGAYAASMEQLHFLRQIVSSLPGQVVLLNGEGEVLYQTASLSRYELSTAELDEMTHDMMPPDERELIIQRESGPVHVFARCLQMEGATSGRVFCLKRVSGRKEQNIAGITIRNFRTEPANKDFFRQNSSHDANIIEVARSFCASNSPVLLTGDVGVGKAEMAESIHRYSEYWMRPYVHIDCTTAQPDAIVSWLEESERSLYNGAVVCFENLDAAGRTLQLHLAELLPTMDPKKWRFLATAQPNIKQQAKEGRFDEKLLRFFSELCLYIPNLSQSHQNLRKIVNLYIIEANSRLGRQVSGMDEDALEMIKNHTWHYNFDELQQAVYQMVLICQGPFITEKEVSVTLSARNAIPGDNGIPLEGTLEEIELQIIRRVLQEEQGNVSRTAERLKIGRSTLWRKLRND